MSCNCSLVELHTHNTKGTGAKGMVSGKGHLGMLKNIRLSYAGFLLGGEARGGICPPPPLNSFAPLKSNRPSSYTATCVFMLPPKISRICSSPPLVTFSEINPGMHLHVVIVSQTVHYSRVLCINQPLHRGH